MRFPTPSAYVEAAQVPQTAFADDELRQAEPETNVLGLPQPITGAFAVVFPMTLRGGRRLAAKGFLSDAEGRPARYRALARHLREHDLDAFVPFSFQPKGWIVEGQQLPLVKMEWADGVPLHRFVEQHHDDTEALRRLQDAWADLLARLEKAEMAHGDLQHGNVFVLRDGAALRLVDYDAVFVPALKGRTSLEVGHRNFSHPDRSKSDFGPHLDRFPGLAVYTALAALREDPSLWDRYDTGENLLFAASDFYDPASSPLFDELEGLPDVAPLAALLRDACYREPDTTPPLADVLAGTAQLSARPHRRPSRSDERPTPSKPRTTFERAFAPTLLTALVTALLLGLLTSAWVGGGAAALVLVLAALLPLQPWRRLPPVRRRKRLRDEIRYLRGLLGRIERDVQARREEREKVLQNVEGMRAERLREVQEEALYDKLKYHFVAEAAEVEGVGHKPVVRLKAANLRTAYQLTPENLKHVKGIGDATRARLAMWRASLVRQYQDAIPDALGPAEERRLERYIEHRLAHADEERARLRDKAQVQREALAEVEERLDGVAHVSFVRYVGYLLRLQALPPFREAAPRPAPRPAAEAAPPATSEPDPNAPWWQHVP